MFIDERGFLLMGVSFVSFLEVCQRLGTGIIPAVADNTTPKVESFNKLRRECF